MGIFIENLEQHTTVVYPLLLLEGSCSTCTGFVNVLVNSKGQYVQFPCLQGKFKALCLLERGHNSLTLSAQHENGEQLESIMFHVAYEPPKPHYRIRLVYGLAKDSNGEFQAPTGTNRSLSQGERRLSLAALLIQTGTAEMLYRHGLGRKTFVFDKQDQHGWPVVTTFRFAFSEKDAFCWEGGQLWSKIREQLSCLPDRENTIDLVVMSFTRYNPVMKVAKAHTALGGDRLALFGGGCLYSWPETIDEVVSRFLDCRHSDPSLFDDSGGRGKMWSITATTIGALLHELGHCLSLPHPTGKLSWRGGGIMARGFDQFNRLFILCEDGRLLEKRDEPFFDRSSAVRLCYHRYLNHFVFQPEPTPSLLWHRMLGQDKPTVARDTNTKAIIVTAVKGIRHISFLVNGDQADHEEYALVESPPVTRVLMNDAQLLKRLNSSSVSSKVEISICDNHGNIVTRNLEEI
eukprot:jgi/Galph1/358/GphlegSOOS_G5109.1